VPQAKKEKILVTEVLKFSEPYRDCYASSAITQTCTDRPTDRQTGKYNQEINKQKTRESQEERTYAR
jgi:hypothetical protein